MNTNDPLHEAFGLLRARSHEQPDFIPELEDRMMKDFAASKRPKSSRMVKVAAAVLLTLVVTGAAAASGGLGALFDWATLTGHLETPDGSSVEVMDGDVISGEINYQGTLHQVVDGKMLDKDGNVIGAAQLNTSTECKDCE